VYQYQCLSKTMKAPPNLQFIRWEDSSYLYRYPTSLDIRQRKCHPAHSNNSIKKEVSKAQLQGVEKVKNAQPLTGQAFKCKLPAGFEPATPSLPWKCSTS